MEETRRKRRVCPTCNGCGFVEEDEGINVNDTTQENENVNEQENAQNNENEREIMEATSEGDESEGENGDEVLAERDGESHTLDVSDHFARALATFEQPTGAKKPPSIMSKLPVIKLRLPPRSFNRPPLNMSQHPKLIPQPPPSNMIKCPPLMTGPPVFMPGPPPAIPFSTAISFLYHSLPPPSPPPAEEPPPIIVRRTEKPKLVCNDCGFETTKQEILDEHASTHTLEKKYACTKTRCHRKFTSAAKLEKHLQNHKYYTCVQAGCDYVTSKRTEFVIHERKHTGERPFVCEQPNCGGKFVSKSSLSLHMSSAHTDLPVEVLKPFACTQEGCLYRAPTEGRLRDHVITHTGERPHACTFPGCSARFGIKATLRTHMNRHTRARTYKCPFEGCVYVASEKEALEIHKRIHTGEKPYECTWVGCGAAFAHRANMKAHMKTHER